MAWGGMAWGSMAWGSMAWGSMAWGATPTRSRLQPGEMSLLARSGADLKRLATRAARRGRLRLQRGQDAGLARTSGAHRAKLAVAGVDQFRLMLRQDRRHLFEHRVQKLVFGHGLQVD